MGRLENGETFAVIDRRIAPCFFVRQSDEEPVRAVCGRDAPGTPVAAVDRTTMDGAPVRRLETPTTARTSA